MTHCIILEMHHKSRFTSLFGLTSRKNNTTFNVQRKIFGIWRKYAPLLQ